MNKEQFLDIKGLSVLVGELLSKIGETGKVQSYNNFLSFPTAGRENILYIDELHNEIYRWDDTSVKYYCVGTNYENIEIISGGTSK